MRKFNREVYFETTESSSRYTSAEFNELLGSADQLIIQFRAQRVTGTTPKITVKLEGSNNGTDWVELQTPINDVSLNVGGVSTGFGSTSVNLPAFVRLNTVLGGTAPVGDITLIVCGRDS
jgi:hypothetical protein